MYSPTELSLDSRRAEIEYRTVKLAAVRRAGGTPRRWRHRGPAVNAACTTK